MGSVNTFQDFQAESASEKVALCIVEVAKRLMGWVVYSGSVYELTSWNYSVITSIEDSGSAYTAVSSIAAVTAGTYFNDRVNRILYLRASDSSNPNSRFLACVFQQFYSNSAGIAAPYDLNTGFDVEWLPYVQDISQFQIQLDNQYQMGDAITGTGDLVLLNDQSYWQPFFDKVYFENQNVFIYSWNRNLPITEAQIIYQGNIYQKKYTATTITLSVKDFLSQLDVPIPLNFISDLASPRAPQSVLNAYQRSIYGYVYGNRPTNIDQVLDGYPMTGTIAISNGSPTLTGTGTKFFTELAKDDNLFFTDDLTEIKYTVKSVIDDLTATLTENYSGLNLATSAITQLPALPKRWQNRVFQIAGHSLCEPSTTVVAGLTTSIFTVVSTSGMTIGDTITVAGNANTIKNFSGNMVICDSAFITIPSPGDEVKRTTISAGYIDSTPMVVNRDFTYDPTASTLTLDKLAEYNVAPVLSLGMASGGSVNFTNTAQHVVGVGTSFTTNLKSGDWIAGVGQADFFEILVVTDDLNITLRTPATYNSSVGASYKKPIYYKEGTNVLSIDLIGKTSDGTVTGRLISCGSDIVKDLLKMAGLSSLIDTASFTNAAQLAPQVLGVAIPTTYTDTTTPKFTDIISQINQNIFGSLIQNSDFELQYSIFSPSKPSDRLILRELDIIDWSVDAKSDNIVQTVEVDYIQKEFDFSCLQASFVPYLNVSNNATYLVGSAGIKQFSSYLINLADAKTLAGRLGFVLEYSASVITVTTKLQAATTSICDTVEIDHEKMYQRVGSSSTRKCSAVLGYKKSASDIQIDLEDLSNAFSRCACITDSDAVSFINADDSEHASNGYYTDAYGMINNDPTTFNNNLIW